MNVSQLAHSLHNIAITINDLDFSERDIREVVPRWLSDASTYTILLELPDGIWYANLYRNGDRYDYYIPETREQEKRIIEDLEKRYNIARS